MSFSPERFLVVVFNGFPFTALSFQQWDIVDIFAPTKFVFEGRIRHAL